MAPQQQFVHSFLCLLQRPLLRTWRPRVTLSGTSTTVCSLIPLFVTETTVKDMEAQSYFEWHLNNSFFNKLHGVGDWKLQLHIMFRTRDEDGVLITTSSASGEQFITLQVGSVLLVIYCLFSFITLQVGSVLLVIYCLFSFITLQVGSVVLVIYCLLFVFFVVVKCLI